MLEAGQEFAQFKILRKLGEGGMGAVYLAEDLKLGREVAVKVLPQEFVADPERLERFQREARTAAKINHPNVTAIYDLVEHTIGGEEGGRPMNLIVMEHVDGEPLNRYLGQRQLDMGEVLRIAGKIAAGLAGAHNLNIVHRDIKPENVIISKDGEPKILDFGLAKPLEPVYQTDDEKDDQTVSFVGDLTQAGKIVGTVNYMSPEQAQGEELDTRSDIFSFGVLLYRLATGEAPFSGPTQVSTLAKIIEGEHNPARLRNETVPPELERIIDKCLQKKPGDRYQDTRDLVVDLRQLRKQFDSGVTESSLSGVTDAVQVRSGGGSWLSKIGIGVAVVAIAAVAFLLARDRDGATDARAGETSLAILNFENRTGDEDLAWLETGLPEILVTDLARCEGLSVLSRERVEDAAKRAAGGEPGNRDRMEASRKLGASTVLSGFYVRAGDQIRIDARLEDVATAKILFADRVVGEDAFALVDSLSRIVTAELHVPMEVPLPSMAEVVGVPAEAYKYYHLGDAKLLISDFKSARELYSKALAVDSTFALPYMRIGMTHAFRGEIDRAGRYLEKALVYKDKLPARDRNMLDVYADVWLRHQYDEVYTKLETLASAYPDDSEIKTLHAALVVGFASDTTRGYGLYQEVFAEDPTDSFALQLYGQDLITFREYHRAIVVFERLKKAYPDSRDAYERLGDCYAALEQNAQALASYQEFVDRFPEEEARVLPEMSSMAILARDFEEARRLADRYRSLAADDAGRRPGAENIQANLDSWEGRFELALDHYRESSRHARDLGDTQRIFFAELSLAVWYQRFEYPDSAIAALKRAAAVAPAVNRMTPPTVLVAIDPDLADQYREELDEAIEAFKAHVPKNLWNLAEFPRSIFEAHANRDTTALIDTYLKLEDLPVNLGGQNRENRRDLAEYLIRVGRYQEGLDFLRKSAENQSEPTNAWAHVQAVYLEGLCLEGLGETNQAVDKYREVLRYWQNADRQIEAVLEAKKRLERLTS